MIKSLLTLSFYLLVISVSAQYNFQRLIGGSHHDRAQTAFNTSDNNYMVNGATLSFGQGSADAMLVKLDSTGQTLWSYSYGTAEYDNSEYAIETSGQDIVCAGRSNVTTGQPTAAMLFKTDAAGQLIWSKSYGGNAADGFVQVIETSDLGYAAVGSSSGLAVGSTDILLVKTDMNGDTIFTHSYGSLEAEVGTGIVQLPDGGFVISGRQIVYSAGVPQADGILLRTDSMGFLLWANLYGDSLWEELTAVTSTPDSALIITGSTVTFGAGDFDVLLMKTDLSGNIQWSKTFGGAKSDAAYDVHVNIDNSIVVSGYTESLGYGHARAIDSSNVFLMKTDEAGSLLWMNVYGDGLQDEAYRSTIASDGGYVLSGLTTNYIFTDSSQMFVLKTDVDGLTGCHESLVTPIDSDITLPYSPLFLIELSGMPVANLNLIRAVVNPTNDDACLFLGVNQIQKTANDISVYPNPFSDKIHINMTDMQIGAEVILYGIAGNVAGRFVVDASGIVNTSNLKSGVYILTINAGSGEIRKCIIKQ